ncbi:MAG: 30S ribosomal protein S16 [Candidatus Paceibacterota bacterium]
MIRFQRIGRTNDPAFRIVVLEKERAAKAGNILELLGTYNPRSKALTLDEEQVKYWISKGAQPTDSIHNLLVNKKVIEGKKVNVLPKKTPQKNEEKIAEEVATAEAAKAAAAAAKAEEAAATAEAVAPVAAEVDAAPMPTEAEVVAEAEPAPAEEAPAETPTETPAA